MTTNYNNLNYILISLLLLICLGLFIKMGFALYDTNNKNNKPKIEIMENDISIAPIKNWQDINDLTQIGTNSVTKSIELDNKVIPNWVQDQLNSTFGNSPNYKNQNITQFNYLQLMKRVNDTINKEQIHLEGETNYTAFTQSTTDDKLRRNLDQITKNVIEYLNNKVYSFVATNYGDVEIKTDVMGNEEIKYELFIWDVKNYFGLKLWVHVIKFIDEKNVGTYGVTNNYYIFPYYNIGMNFQDQIIPNPMDVIISCGMVLSKKSVKPNDPAPIKTLYLNKIEIQQSTLIVDYQKDKYEDNKLTKGLVNQANDNEPITGTTDSTVEFIKFKPGLEHTPFTEEGRQYFKWPTLDEEPKWKAQFPAKNPPLDWDMDGVYYYGKGDPKEFVAGKCSLYQSGTRWSNENEPLQPYFTVSNYGNPKDCGDNGWLFANANGTEGVFFGGGKK